jgi:hypothetical protein
MAYVGNKPPVVDNLITDIKIGEDDETKIDFADANTINFHANNSKEMVLVENALTPGTSDGIALGTTSLMWSDLFLASGSVINLNNGDVTLTHSANTLTVAGGTLATAALTSSTITASGIIKTDDTTEATSTTDGSLQTDGGLSVAKDAVIGDDVFLLSDSAVLNMGADNDVTFTHDGTTGLTIAANPFEVDSGGNITLDSHTGIFIFQDANSEVLRITEGNSGDVTIKLETNGKDLIFTDNGDAAGLTIKDAQGGIVVPGEVMTTKISYTDGDDAITIADGGGTTFAQSVTLADDKTITLADEGQLIFGDTAPSTDHTATGVVVSIASGESVTAFNAVYIRSDGEVGPADADAATSMPAIGVALESKSDGQATKILISGVLRDDTYNFTPGADLFVGTTAGEITATAPSGSGDTVQKIGVALTADSIYVNFNTTEVLLA